MEYIPPVNGDPGDPDRSYIDGNPGAGIEGSIPPAESFEHPQREIVNVIIAAGLTPDGANLAQLLAAITALIAANVAPDATTAVKGIVEKATSAEVKAQTADKYPDSADLKYHPGIAKAWLSLNAISGTPVVNASHNVSSVTDLGVGRFQVNLAAALTTATYAVAINVSHSDGEIAYGRAGIHTKTTTTFVMECEIDDNTQSDPQIYDAVLFGGM